MLFLKTSKISDGNMSFKWGDEKEVLHNREKYLSQFNVSLQDCMEMKVEHGDKIVVVDKHSQSPIEAEALITKEKNLFLFLVTADCLPIVIYDPINEVVALAHLGWKPTELKLVIKVINEMKEKFSSHPEELQVHIGPGIHRESFAFINPIQKTLPGWEPFLHDLSSGETQIDSVAYNKAQIMSTGVPKQNITVDSIDTATSPDYFSHYRSVRTNEPEGRFATVCGIQ